MKTVSSISTKATLAGLLFFSCGAMDCALAQEAGPAIGAFEARGDVGTVQHAGSAEYD